MVTTHANIWGQGGTQSIVLKIELKIESSYLDNCPI